MRGSSSSSSVTIQPPPLSSARPKPETDSTGLPNNSSICSRARPTSSGGERLFLLSAMETVEEPTLHRLVGFLVDLASLERCLGICQLGTDARRIVELGFGLVDHLL